MRRQEGQSAFQADVLRLSMRVILLSRIISDRAEGVKIIKTALLNEA